MKNMMSCFREGNRMDNNELSTNLAEVGTDCISRQAAIDALRKMQTYKMFSGDDMLLIDQAGAMTELMLLPPAEPKRIRGKWIEHEHGYWTFVNADGERDGWIPDYECDQCGSRGWKEVAPMNFCPNCGAKMEDIVWLR